jgi:hypothetical protein
MKISKRMLWWSLAVAASIAMIAILMSFVQHRIMEIERDAMLRSIIEIELKPPYGSDRLDSDYARLLLGDEVDTLKDVQQRLKKSSP